MSDILNNKIDIIIEVSEGPSEIFQSTYGVTVWKESIQWVSLSKRSSFRQDSSGMT